MSQGREMEGLFYEQPEDKVDGSCHSKEGSKSVRGGEWGKKRTEESKGEKCRVHIICACIQYINECL